MRPLVKCVLEVSSPDEVARATRTALGQASAGEPGPVLLQLTSQALSGAGSSPEPETASPLHEPDTGAIAERLLAARRPLLLVGQGAADAAPEVRRLAEWLRSPVIATTSGRGVVSERHPLCIASDVAGGPAAPLNDLVARADLVLALGCKLSHNGSRGYTLVLPAERLVRVDASREVLGLAYPSSEAVEADVGVFLTSVRRQTDGRAPASEWTDNEIASWRTKNAAQRPARFNPQLGPGPASELFAALRRHLPDRAVVASDSGLHQYVVRANFPVVEPRTLLVPTDFQSMGYGVPAAIGGSIATGERAVAVTGDGGFNIVGLELRDGRTRADTFDRARSRRRLPWPDSPLTTRAHRRGNGRRRCHASTRDVCVLDWRRVCAPRRLDRHGLRPSDSPRVGRGDHCRGLHARRSRRRPATGSRASRLQGARDRRRPGAPVRPARSWAGLTAGAVRAALPVELRC